MARTAQLTSPLVAAAVLLLGGVILGQALFLHPDGIPAVVRLHDHVVHSIVYGAVGAAVAWWSTARPAQRGPAYHLALVQLVALHLGLADEILQSTSLGREASPHDLIADLAGAFAGGTLVLRLRRPPILTWTRRTVIAGGLYGVALAVGLTVGGRPKPPPAAGVVAWMSPGAPSRCGDATSAVTWRLDAGNRAQRAALVEGWSVDERLADRTAAWSEGARSRLEVALPPRPGPQRLVVVAMGAVDPAVARPARVMVSVNGRRLGRLTFPHDFVARTITVPDGLLVRGTNAIELEHLDVFVPPADGRALSIMLDEVCLEALN